MKPISRTVWRVAVRFLSKSNKTNAFLISVRASARHGESQTGRIAGLTVAVLLLLPGCARPFPVGCNEALTYSRTETPIAHGQPGYEDTLQIRWLGTASHFIQVGDVAILTDPYYSHYNVFRMYFGTIPSDPQSVRNMTHDLPRPDAIFIGHAHYDHMLDLAEVRRQKQWSGVPIIGGPTVGNIVAGYREGIEDDCRSPCAEGAWCSLGAGVEYRAVPGMHAPHFLGKMFFPGAVTEPRITAPTRARDFPLGEPYTYLFRLPYTDAAGQQKHFTIFFAGAATDAHVGIPETLDEPLDVAILCGPSWKNVSNYPAGVIERLRPRVIIVTHLNNFLQDGWEKRELVASAHVEGFLSETRSVSAYDEFERIVITDMGSTVRVQPRSE